MFTERTDKFPTVDLSFRQVIGSTNKDTQSKEYERKSQKET